MGGGGAENTISAVAPPKQLHNFFYRSHGVNLVKLKLSMCGSFSSMFHCTLFWWSSNTFFFTLNSVIPPNMVGDTFLTDGGGVAATNLLYLISFQLAKNCQTK